MKRFGYDKNESNSVEHAEDSRESATVHKDPNEKRVEIEKFKALSGFPLKRVYSPLDLAERRFIDEGGKDRDPTSDPTWVVS